MTRKDIDRFLEENKHITIKEDDDAIYCRNEYLPWYQSNPSGSTRIVKDALSDMDAEKLMDEINRGLEIEQITRITGYMTKVASWNKGKRGELTDRVRVGNHFGGDAA